MWRSRRCSRCDTGRLGGQPRTCSQQAVFEPLAVNPGNKFTTCPELSTPRVHSSVTGCNEELQDLVASLSTALARLNHLGKLQGLSGMGMAEER